MRTLADDATVIKGLVRLHTSFKKYIDASNKGRFEISFQMQSDFDWVHRVYIDKPSSDITKADMIRMNEIWKKYSLKNMEVQ